MGWMCRGSLSNSIGLSVTGRSMICRTSWKIRYALTNCPAFSMTIHSPWIDHVSPSPKIARVSSDLPLRRPTNCFINCHLPEFGVVVHGVVDVIAHARFSMQLVVDRAHDAERLVDCFEALDTCAASTAVVLATLVAAPRHVKRHSKLECANGNVCLRLLDERCVDELRHHYGLGYFLDASESHVA